MENDIELFLKNPWLYLLGLVLIGSYFFLKKKFENLADKDDIADITREVESVKKEFNEDLERLKTDLDILKSNRINLVNEKRKVIYDFWASANIWERKVDGLLNVDLENYSDYQSFVKELSLAQDDFIVKKAFFELQFRENLDEESVTKINSLLKNLFEKEMYERDAALKILNFKISEFETQNKKEETYRLLLLDYLEEKKPLIESSLKSLKLIEIELLKILKELHK